MKKIFPFILISSLLLAACNETTNQSTTTSQDTTNESSTMTQTETSTKYTFEEISKHNTQNDCWLLINGKIYDVTEYAPNHPGGEAIFMGCGKDATNLFEERPGDGTPHSEKARNYMENFYIGDLTP